MDFGWPPELEAFRAEIKVFIKEWRTPELLEEVAAQGHGSQRAGPRVQAVIEELDRRGWLRKSWPIEDGGEGASPWYRFILAHELRYAGIPFSRGTATMLAPAITRFGTEEQKRYYVPRLWSGEITCALGYSEPDAGTDLASLKTRAERDGDDYIINGQKIWTSGAHSASHVWLATRTDPEAPKHRGISVFIVPLDSPGITIRPIWVMSGMRTNEVFYENVRVPGSARIGEENRGWYIVANALDHERVTVGIDDMIDLIQVWDELIAFLRSEHPEKLEDELIARQLAELKRDLRVHRALLLANACIVARGETPTMQASMVKIWGSELRHRLSDVAMDILGRYGLLSNESGELSPMAGRLDATFRYAPVVRFAGGTNEIQRDIIARRGLGLPR